MDVAITSGVRHLGQMVRLFKRRSKPASSDPSTVPFLVRHGDVLVQRVDALPASAQRRPGQVLVRGEATGHSHRNGEAGAAALYETVDDLFLEITAALGALVHEEHGPIELRRAVW